MAGAPQTKARTVATVRQIVLASPRRVFDAMTTPADIGSWMFGPNIRSERVLGLDVDLRIGGRFSFRVERGDEVLDHVGIYRALDPSRALSFTWSVNGPPEKGDLIVVRFMPLAVGTEVQLSHALAPDWVDAKPSVEAAWTKMLRALARHSVQ